MDVKQIIKSIVVMVGIVSLLGMFVVNNETFSSLLFVVAVFCALLPHFINTNERKELRVVSSPIPLEQEAKRALEEKDLPPLPPHKLKLPKFSVTIDKGQKPKTVDEAMEEEPEEVDEKKQKKIALMEECKRKMEALDVEEEPPQNVVYDCPKCGKQFADKKKLQRHIGMAHYMDVKL